MMERSIVSDLCAELIYPESAGIQQEKNKKIYRKEKGGLTKT